MCCMRIVPWLCFCLVQSTRANVNPLKQRNEAIKTVKTNKSKCLTIMMVHSYSWLLSYWYVVWVLKVDDFKQNLMSWYEWA